MADIKLTRPVAGQNVVIPSTPDARMVLDFPADQVSIDRPQGSDSLFFRFDDGSSIELQNFYAQYNKEAIPSFEVDGQLIAGADFFSAFGPDLAPAAGPAASSPTGGGYQDFANSALASGINHLDGLDLSFSGSARSEQLEAANGFLINSEPTLSTGGSAITLGLTEAGESATNVSSPGVPSMSGSFTANDVDGDSLTATVNMGGRQIGVSLSGPTTIESDYGTLVITPQGGGSNVTFNFTYTLKQDPYSATDSLAQGEQHTDSIVISVSDGKGHTVTQPINAVITGSNDAPDIQQVNDFQLKDDGVYASGSRSDTLNSAENKGTVDAGQNSPGVAPGDAEHRLYAEGQITARDPDHNDVLTYGIKSVAVGNVSYGDSQANTGADADHAAYDRVITTDYGKLYFSTETGKYRFDLDTSKDGAVNKLAEGDTVNLSVTPTVTDSHGVSDANPNALRADQGGAAVDGTINIAIHGSNEAPVIDQPAAWNNSADSLVEAGVGVSGRASITGSLGASDADTGDNVEYRLVSVEGGESRLYETLYLVKDGNGGVKAVSTPGVDGDADYYGKVSLVEVNGKAQYTVDLFNKSTAVQELRGDGTTDKDFSFTVAAQDKYGAYTQQTVTGKIQGSNDAPTIAYSKVHLREEGVWNDSNDPTIRDSKDDGGFSSDQYHRDPVSGTLVGSDIDNTAGELRYAIDTHNGSGFLLEGGGMTVDVYNHAKDANGNDVKNYTGEQLVLKIISVTDGGATQTITTNYGTLVLTKATGAYTFTLGGDANALDKGDTFDFQFRSVVTDPAGASGTHILGVTIEGANDKPVLGFVDAPGGGSVASGDMSVAESGVVASTETVSAYVHGTDPDTNASLQFGLTTGHNTVDSIAGRNAAFASAGGKAGMGDGVTTVTGDYGSLTIEASGKYTYTLDSRANALDDGDNPKENFTIYVRDEHGAWDAKQVTISVHGANDAPVIGGAVDLGVAETGVRADAAHPLEGGNAVFSGKNVSGVGHISADDADAHDKLTYSVTSAEGTGAVGGMTAVADIKTDAHYDDAAKALVVNGNNYNAAYRVASGTLYLNTDSGKYVFELNDTVADHLPQDAKQAVSFSISVSDGDATVAKDHAINVFITGTNDRPTLGFVDAKGNPVTGGSLAVTEKGYNVAGQASASGYVHGDDHDDGAVLHYGLVAGNVAQGDEFGKLGTAFGADAAGTAGMGDGVAKVTGVYGTLTLVGGKYTYTLNNNKNSAADKLGLKADGTTPETAQDDFTVYVRDEHGAWSTQHIAVTVTGSNDAPVLSAVNRSVVESGVKDGGNQTTGGTPSVSGTLAVTDVDVIDHGTKQTFAVNGVKADGTDVTPTVASGSFTVGTGTYDASYTVDAGVLYLNTATGAYAFVLNNNAGSVNGLDLGDTLPIKFSVTVADVHGAVSIPQDITVTIKGTNDKPSLTLGYEKGITHETQAAAGATPAYEQVHVADSNNDASGHVPGSLTTALGTAASADDDASAKAYFGAVKGLVAEGPGSLSAAKIAGTSFNAVDKTDKASATSEVTVQGLHGTLHVYANGKYFYEMDAQQADKGGAINHLKDGDHFDDTFTILVKDEHGAWTTRPITVRIDGVNDAPYLLDPADIAGTVKESGQGYSDAAGTHGNTAVSGIDSVSGTIHIADDDSTASNSKFAIDTDSSNVGTDGNGWLTYTTSYGMLHLNAATGEYRFDLDNALQAVKQLQQGDTVTLKIPLVVTDDGGAKQQFSYTLTVQGTNDKPVLTLKDGTLSVTDGDVTSATSAAGNIVVTEDDAVDSQTFGIVDGAVKETDTTTPVLNTSMSGHYGTLTINPKDGTYTYTLANNNADVIAKGAGETLTDTFQVAVVDSHGAFSLQTVTVTVHGKDDATVINLAQLAPAHNVIESGVLPSSAMDKDHAHNNYTDGSAGVATTYGYIGARDDDGTDQKALNSTAADAKLHYVIQVTDHKGTVATDDDTTVERDLNVLMHNTSLRTAAFDKDTQQLVATDGKPIAVGDAVRVGGQLVIKLENGALTIETDSSGNGLYKYTYTLDNADPDVQKLNFHEPGSDSFTVAVKNGSTVPSSLVTITIEGANDRPEITATPPIGIHEGDAVSTAGHVALKDYEQTDGSHVGASGFIYSLVPAADATSGDSPVMQGLYGRLVLDQATGEYKYYRTADVSTLSDNSTVNDTFYVRVQDKDGAYSTVKPITVTITGENQPGVMAGGSASLKEDGVGGNVPGTLHYTNDDKLGANDTQALTPDNAKVDGKLVIDVHDTNIVKDSSGNAHVATGTPNSYSPFVFEAGQAKLTDAHGHDTVLSLVQSGNTYTLDDYGELTVHGDGTYSFTAATQGTGILSNTLNSLGEGESVTITVPATAHSEINSGEIVHGNITITISGTNDVPVVNIASPKFEVGYTDAFTGQHEDAGFSTLADPAAAITYLTDHPDLIKAYVAQSIDGIMSELKAHSGLFGGILSAFGVWDNVQNLLTNLATGVANAADDFGKLDNLLTQMGRGNDVSNFLTNHAGVLMDSDEIASWSGKSGDPVVRGTLNSELIEKDVDNDHTLTFFALDKDGTGNLVQQAEGQYGTLVINPNGTYQYILDRSPNSKYQNYVNSHWWGDTTTESFTIYVRDEHNAVAEKPIELVINVGKAGTGVGDDGIHSGNLAIKTVSDSVQEDGMINGHTGGKTVAVGTVVNGDHNKVYDSGMFLLDASGGKTSVMTTKYGTVTLLPDGSYSYVLNNDLPIVQALAQDESITDTFTFTNGDKDHGVKKTEQINITITGTNDAPYVVSQGAGVAFSQGKSSESWTADGGKETSTFVVNDVDHGDNANLILWAKDMGTSDLAGYEKAVASNLGGTFYIHNAGDGSFTYTYKGPSGNCSGKDVLDSQTIQVSDGHGGVVDVKLTATLNAFNDKPTVPDQTAHVTEDGGSAALVATGDMIGSDDKPLGGGDGSLTYKALDADAHGMVTRSAGTLVMDSNGHYTFYLNNSSDVVQALGKDETRDEVFSVVVSDGQGEKNQTSLTVTITGTNDIPVLSLHAVDVKGDLGAPGSGAIGYLTDGNALLTVSGKAQTHDMDSSDHLTLTLNGHGLNLVQDVYARYDGATDQWTVCNSTDSNAVNMGRVELRTDGSYHIESPGNNIAQLQNIYGHYDAYTHQWTICNSTDSNAVLLGNIELQADGSYNFESSGNNISQLQDVYARYDESAHQWKVCEGTDDKAVNMGRFELQHDGSYSFVGNSSGIAHLGQGDHLDVTASIGVNDGHGGTVMSTVTVNITGTNDKPVLSSFSADSLTDDHSDKLSFTGQITASDVDGTGAGDGLTYYIKSGSSYVTQLHAGNGTLHLIGSGYTYVLDDNYADAFKALGEGESAAGGKFTIVAVDKYGAESSLDLTITLNGANDAPTITSTGWTGSAELTEQGYLNPAQADSISGTVVGHDVDTSDNGHLSYGFVGSSSVVSTLYAVPDGASFKLVEGEPADHNYFGTFTMNAGTGAYTFTLNNAATCVQQMGGSDAIHISADVAVKDPHGLVATQTIGLDIHGSNDAPTVTSAVWQGGNELTEAGYDNLAAVAAITGTVTGQDVDAGDAAHLSYGFVLTLAGVQTVAQTLYAVPDGTSFSLVDTIPADHNYYGTFTMNGGEYTFTLNNDADCVQHLNVADTLHLGAQVVAVDQGHAVSEPVDISLTIHGSNDAPVVHVDGFNIYATDVDSSLSFNVQDDALYGHITQQTDGSYAYTLNVDDATALNSLSAAHVVGGIITDGAGYSVSDGHTSASGTVSVGVSVDNWDGHGGHLLFSAQDANGHYTAQAASGHNVILGGGNDDILYGGTGDDILYGGAGHNELHGGGGNNYLYAGNFGDHLYGGDGNDHLYGGTSNDFLDGGKGSNVLDGGAGNDVLVFHQGDHIDGGADTDMLLVSGTDTTSVDDLFNSKTSNIEVIVKGSAVDSLTDMKALADKGISFNEHNQVELDAGKGWQDTHTSVDGHDVWTNTAGDLTVTIKHDDAENAKNVIVATHNS